MADTTDSPLLCAMCHKPGTSACNGCHNIHYCSRKCQKQDWPLHKLVCKDWGMFQDSNRPSQSTELLPLELDFNRGIYFPENGAQPQFIWLAQKLHENDKMEFVIKSFTENLTGLRIRFIINNSAYAYQYRPIGKKIFLACRWTEHEHGPKYIGTNNKSFQKINKELVDEIRGPVLAYGFDDAQQKFIDLDMVDLRFIIDFYRVDFDRRVRIYSEIVLSNKVMGVRRDCIGDCTAFRYSEAEEIVVRFPDQEEGVRDCPGSAKIGIPLIVIPIRPGISWRGRTFEGDSVLFNPIYNALTSYETFDTTLCQGRDNQERHALLMDKGTVVVVRQDRKPLHSAHLEAISSYLMNMLKCSVAQHSSADDTTTLDSYLAALSRERFARYYDYWVQKNKADFPGSALLPSPYDV